MTHRIKPQVGDTPEFGAVRFALPIGDTREDMRNWLQKSEVGQSLYNCGDCVLVWANEGDLFTQHRPTDPLAEAMKLPKIKALVAAANCLNDEVIMTMGDKRSRLAQPSRGMTSALAALTKGGE